MYFRNCAQVDHGGARDAEESGRIDAPLQLIQRIHPVLRAVADRLADVAVVSVVRLQQADPDDNLPGAPDVVIEVLSPSNTVAEIIEKQRLCLENGCREFWAVEPKSRVVNVSTPDGITRTYQEAGEIPLALFGNARLPVAAIFE
jgi:Uma2 family endonuclease